MLIPATQGWKDRAEILSDVYLSEGWGVKIYPIKGEQCPDDLDGFNVVCNHALQAPPVKIRALANAMPDKQFVHVNHSAMGHLEQKDKYINRICDVYHSTRQMPNIWLAGVEATTLPDLPRAVHLPMVPNILAARKYRAPSNPPIVAIAGRAEPIKNWMNQIQAVVMCGAKLFVCCPPHPAMKNFLRASGVSLIGQRWMPSPDWLTWLAEVPDVLLQVSFAESFNCIAAEAMQSGVPTVCGSTIRFADPELVADPNNVHDIASKLRKAINSHRKRSETAVLLSDPIKDNPRRHLEVIEAIASV